MRRRLAQARCRRAAGQGRAREHPRPGDERGRRAGDRHHDRQRIAACAGAPPATFGSAARTSLPRPAPAATPPSASAIATLLERPRPMAERDALARLAQDSDDPQIYAWAYRGCQSAKGSVPGRVFVHQRRRSGPISIPRTGRRLDGGGRGGAGPQGRRRRRGRAVPRRPCRARRPRLRSARCGNPESRSYRRRNAAGTVRAAGQASGIEASRLRGLVSTLEHCSEKELVDSNRRETCERIAAVMTDRSIDDLTRDPRAASIGKRLGWPAERLDALQRELDAGQAAVERQSQRAAKDPLSLRDVSLRGRPRARHRPLGRARSESPTDRSDGEDAFRARRGDASPSGGGRGEGRPRGRRCIRRRRRAASATSVALR